MRGVDVNRVVVLAAQLVAIPALIIGGILIALTDSLVLIIAYWSLALMALAGSFAMRLHLASGSALFRAASGKPEGWARNWQELFGKRLRAIVPVCELGYFVHALSVPSRKDRKVQLSIHMRYRVTDPVSAAYVILEEDKEAGKKPLRGPQVISAMERRLHAEIQDVLRENRWLQGEGCYVERASRLQYLLTGWLADRTSGTGIKIVEASILDIAG
jgi:hypothetical protein